MIHDPAFGPDLVASASRDLRQQVGSALLDRLQMILADASSLFPSGDAQTPDEDYGRRIGRLLGQLLALAVREGKADASGELIANLHRAVLARGLSVETLFSFAHVMERTALEELAVNATIGATTEAWPMVAQLIRRGSFDALAAYTERMRLEPTSASLVDRVTTLHTRPLFDLVLAKELERASRTGASLSLVLVDVDALGTINAEHGYGVGDKVLERLGVTLRQYFRQHDWVARYRDDSIVALLSAIYPERASELADQVRATIEARLRFPDHRTGRTMSVTVSVGVVNARLKAGDIVDPERLLVEVEAVVARAKQAGGNRVVRTDDVSAIIRTLPRSSPSA